MAEYNLQGLHPGCGKEYEGSRSFRLRCDEEIHGSHGPALLRGLYESAQITVRTELPGIFQYADWLPTGPYYLDAHVAQASPCVYKSRGLAKRLGLDQLYIAFSGYWPNKNANLVTRTFKEFEA